MDKPDRHDKIAAVVGTITNDPRQWVVPKMKVCALRITERARARMEKSGCEILTFDQLAMRSPKGQHTILLQGMPPHKVHVCYHIRYCYYKVHVLVT